MEFVNFMVAWAPTFLFVLIILVGFLIGVLRGLRNNRISLIHSLCAGLVCFVLFLLFTNLNSFDKFLLNVVNLFTGDIRNDLGVSSDIDTLKGVLVAYIPKALSKVDAAASIAVSENSRYVLALVNLIYNVVFAIICFVLYLILRAILFACCVIFYPEWRYKIKYKKKVSQNKKIKPYKKRRLAGGLIGLCTSFFVAIISFSFLGNILYMVAGAGEEGLPEHTFADEQTNDIYGFVNSIEQYGNTGIFKVLNLAKDNNGTPLYLYIGGLVYSGEIENLDGTTDRLFLTHEVGNYTTFLKDTASLAIKYGGEVVDSYIEGNQPDIINTVTDLLSIDAFRSEFRMLLESQVNKSTFIGDFVFSAMDTYAANLEESVIYDSFNAEVKEVINVLFNEGYKSNDIPFERNYSGDAPLPYIKASDIIDKNDILVVYDTFVDLVDAGLYNTEEDIINVCLSATQNLENLKLFREDNANKAQINGVLGRLYSYVESKILEEEFYLSQERYPDNLNVKWSDEMAALLHSSPDLKVFYSTIKEVSDDNGGAKEYISAIFDNTNVLNSYDRILDFVEDSQMAARVVSTSYAYKRFESKLSSLSDKFDYPENIQYVNTYSSDGKVIYGELHNLLTGVRKLATGESSRPLLDAIVDGNDEHLFDLLKAAEPEFVHVESDGFSLVDYLSKSVMLRALSSAFLISSTEDDTGLYIPDIARQKNSAGEYVNIIKENEFNILLDSLFTEEGASEDEKGIIDLLPDDAHLNSDTFFNEFIDYNSNLFDNKVLRNLICNSSIIQTTIGNKLINDKDNLGALLVLPDNLTQPEDWLTEYYTEDGVVYIKNYSEALNLFDSLHELFGDSAVLKDIDVALDNILKTELSSFNYTSNIFPEILSHGEILSAPSKTLVVCNSDVLRATISDYFIQNVKNSEGSDLLPERGIELAKDEHGIIKTEEFVAIIDVLDFMEISDVTEDGAFEAIEEQLHGINGLLEFDHYGENDCLYDSLLNVIYKSTPIKYYLSQTLYDSMYHVITGDAEPGDTDYDQDVEKLSYYSVDSDCEFTVFYKTEIEAFLKGLIVVDYEDDSSGNGLNSAGNKVEEMFGKYNYVITHEKYPDVVPEGVETTRLNVIYDSNLFKFVLTDSLKENIDTNDHLQDHPEAYELMTVNEVNEISVYKYLEVHSLVNILAGDRVEDDDHVHIEDFDNSSLTLSKLLSDYFDHDTREWKSKILLSSISLSMIENADINNGVSPDQKTSIIVPKISINPAIEEYDIIYDEEVYQVLYFCNDTLGIDTIAQFDDGTFNNSIFDVLLTDLIEPIKTSDIIRATVSDRIIYQGNSYVPINLLDNYNKINPESVDYDPLYTDKLISEFEIENLFVVCNSIFGNSCNIDDLNDYDFKSLSLAQAKAFVNASDIISATVSMNLIGEDPANSYLIIPKSASNYDATTSSYVNTSIVQTHISARDYAEDIYVISIDEINYVFDALIRLQISDVNSASSIDKTSLDPARFNDYDALYPQQEKTTRLISKSSILRATITDNVNFGDDIVVMALDDIDTDEIDNSILSIGKGFVPVLYDHEVEHLLDDLNIYRDLGHGSSSDPLSCDFGFNTLYNIYNQDRDSFSRMLTSDIVRIAISHVIIELENTVNLAPSGFTYENFKVYNIATKTSNVYTNVCDATTIINYLDYYKSILG